MTLDQIIERCRLPIRVEYHPDSPYSFGIIAYGEKARRVRNARQAKQVYLEVVSEQYQVGSMR